MMQPRSLRSALAAVCGLAVVLSLGTFADARKKKRAKPATAQQKKELGSLMGEFSFSMTKKEVIGKLKKELRERYQLQISATTDVSKQDKLRSERDAEIKRIVSSYADFKGKRSGWDVSIVDDQFAHHTGESMLVYWDNVDGKNQRRFFFFDNGKLYKMFIALDSSVLKKKQRSFAFLQDAMEKRFGSGSVVYRTDREGVEHPDHIAWSGRRHVVKAFDKLSFYGSFCLSIADPAVEKQILARRAKNKKAPTKNQVIEAVVQKGDADKPSLDDNAAAVDALLGD